MLRRLGISAQWKPMSDGDGRPEGLTVAGPDQVSGVFEVDEDHAASALELVWADAGYHGFCAGDGGLWSAISSAGDVLTGDTPDALNREIRLHWQAMQ